MNRIRMWAVGLGVVSALVITGCTKSPGVPVKGTATLDGTPITEGTITFHSEENGKGRTAGGAIKNGTFDFPAKQGITLGKKTVSILAVVKTGKQVPAGPPSPAGTMVDDVVTVQGEPQPTEIVAPMDNKPIELKFEISSKKK